MLQLGWNPITPIGAMEILQFVKDNKNCAIKELDLSVRFCSIIFSKSTVLLNRTMSLCQSFPIDDLISINSFYFQ